MNPTQHCKISVRRWGGVEKDYIDIHAFIDETKVLCADARHRIFHTHWALKYIVEPIFGFTLVNSDGKQVDIKDMCERDHLLVDYHNKFIPTLSDFVEALSDEALPKNFDKKIERLHSQFSADSYTSSILLSPLAVTGRLKSLLITHNSWFINTILPKIVDSQTLLLDFEIAPSEIFKSMKFELWMDNGVSFPDSAKEMKAHLI